MNSKFNLIFVCFLVNLINVFNVSTVKYNAFGVNANPLDNLFIYNDSTISALELSFKDIYNLHHAFVTEHFKWPNGRINFKIDKKFDDNEIDMILTAMHEIEKSSCIRFAAHDPSNGPDYVMIKKDYVNRFRSSSNLGCCHQGEQLLWLGVGMIHGHKTILHEILHTIGFHHHHQRSDRDNYIEIHLENTILSEMEILVDYAKGIKFDPRVKHFTPFDFDSVMLYDEYSGSVNGMSVITSKIEGKKLATRRDRGLSRYDRILLNRFYDCNTVGKEKSSIFYENEYQIVYPKVVNYHEIQRAKDYFDDSEPEFSVTSQMNEREKDDLLNNIIFYLYTNSNGSLLVLKRFYERIGDDKQQEENLMDGIDVNNTNSVNTEVHQDENGDGEVVAKLHNNEDEYDEEDNDDQKDQMNGHLQDVVQNANSTDTDSVIESYDKNSLDKLHEENREQENLLDGHNANLIKNDEDNQIDYQYDNSGASELP